MASDMIGEVRFDDVRGMHVIAALSGGADSVALLCLMNDARASHGLKLTAAHFHHGIRGEAADADAEFCRALCERIGVELVTAQADVPAIARRERIGLETAAREARYAFLRTLQRERGADVIALAHHLNDQAETVLMHLLRGAGPEGICGMARLRDGLYRPLLDVPKHALVQYLEEKRIGWREDASNAVSDNPRNALRLNVLPEIEKSYPSAAAAIARYGRLAKAESDFLERAAGEFLAGRLEHGPYGCRLMLRGDEDEALLRRAVRRIAGGHTDAAKTDAVIALCRESRGRMEISGRLAAERTPSALYFLPPKPKDTPAERLNIPGETMLAGICRIVAEEGNFPIEPGNPRVEILNADALEGAVLRTRRVGDRMHPLGAPGTRLLSDCMTDRKIDRPLRDFLPLIACGNRVIWAQGLGIAQEARLQTVTKRSVRLTIHPITDEKPEVEL